MTSDSVYDEVATSRTLRGVGEVIPVWQGWKEAMPDVKGTVTNACATGNTVVLEVTWRGTHSGPLQTPNGPIAATGKRIEVRACMAIEVAGDKAKAQRHYFDMGTLLQQIGVAG